jgi:hypothetical protein
MRILALAVLSFSASLVIHAQSSLPPFPAPATVVQDDKQFNATTIGPGNTFTVCEAPDDVDSIVSGAIKPQRGDYL